MEGYRSKIRCPLLDDHIIFIIRVNGMTLCNRGSHRANKDQNKHIDVLKQLAA